MDTTLGNFTKTDFSVEYQQQQQQPSAPPIDLISLLPFHNERVQNEINKIKITTLEDTITKLELENKQQKENIKRIRMTVLLSAVIIIAIG